MTASVPPGEQVSATVVLFGPQPFERMSGLSAAAAMVGGRFTVAANGVDACQWVDVGRLPAEWTVLRDPANPGLSRPFNTALANCGTTWLLLLDQDSEIDASAWDRLVDVASRAAPDVAVVTGTVLDVGTGATTRRRTGAPSGTEHVLRVPLFQNSGSLVRVQAARSVGGWWEHLHVDLVDAEFGVRLHRAGWRQLHVELPVLRHRLGATVPLRVGPIRGHATNHSRDRRREQGRALAAILRRHGAFGPDVRSVARNVAGNLAGVVLAEDQKIGKVLAFGAGFLRELARGAPSDPPGTPTSPRESVELAWCSRWSRRRS